MKTGFILKAVFHNIKHRKTAFLISVFAIAIAFTFLSAVGSVTFGLAASAVNSSLKYPLIIGPEGSSDTQLVMSSVFAIDKPAGKIRWELFEEIQKEPGVVAAYPLARADNLKSIPIVGVNSEFVKNINEGFYQIKEGIDPDNIFSETDVFRAVLGFKVAEMFAMKPGIYFTGTHGAVGDESARAHDEQAYQVVAVMNPVNGPEDFQIFVSCRSVWEIHESEEENEPMDVKTNEISAVLVKTTNPVVTSRLEGKYSSRSGSTATDTGKTVRRIVQYMNKAENIAGLFSYGTLFIVLVMVFVTILMSINERKKEMALMRTLGIGRGAISLTVMIETVIITFIGVFLGIIAGHSALWYFKPMIDLNLGINLEPFIFTSVEIQGIVLTLLAGQVLALLGMLRIYRMNLIEEVARD